MLSRWIAITFALVPVVFFPTCAATYAVMVFRARTPVAGQVTAEFPILQTTGGVVDIVPFRARDPRATSFVSPGDQKRVADAVEKLPTTKLSDQDRHMGAKIEFENLRAGLERIHITVRHEAGMGFIRTESWYDTDGTSLRPRFERQYPPSWMVLGAFIIAIPISFVVAGVVARILIWRKPIAPPPVIATRIGIAVVLYLAAAFSSVGAHWLVFAGLPIVVAAAFVPWRKRWGAIAIVSLVAVDIALGFLIPGYAMFLVVISEIGIAVLTAVAAVIQIGLSAALSA
jgi:hypothetical protein